MKALIPLSFLFICCPALADPTNLTIFTDDGEPFYLHINGEQQNRRAGARVTAGNIHGNAAFVRVELAKEGYREHSQQLKLTEFPSISDSLKAKNTPMDVVYRLHFEQGEYQLIFVSAGESKTAEPKTANPAVQGAAVPTDAGTGPDVDVNASVNVGAGNMSFSFNIGGNANAAPSSAPAATPPPTAPAGPAYGPGCAPMAAPEFERLVRSIKGLDFEDTRLTTAKRSLETRCVTSRQTAKLMKVFDFDETRLELATYLYERVSDPDDFHIVNNSFSMPDIMAEELNEALGWDSDSDW